MSRPSKLTPELCEKILMRVRAGNFIEPAAVASGIHGATLYRWKNLAAGGREPYASFARALKEAEAQSEDILVQALLKQAPRNPTAAIALLKQRFPERWTPIEKREVKLEGNQNIRLTYERGTLREWAGQLEEIPD